VPWSIILHICGREDKKIIRAVAYAVRPLLLTSRDAVQHKACSVNASTVPAREREGGVGWKVESGMILTCWS